MRLGQLARKLAIRPSQIIDYLATKQEFPEEGSNAKLSDEITEQIVLHFAPDRLSQILESEEKAPVKELASVEEESIIELTPTVEAEITEAPQSLSADTTTDKPEVIKAPKIELSGLKVLGKIELKDIKKKEINPQETKEEDTAIEKRSNEKRPTKYKQDKRTQGEREWRNPIAMQREREAREAEAKRKRELELEKERRTINYQKRVKPPQPIKAVKLYDEPAENVRKKKTEEKPKSLLGRFLRWLNS
ncbi:MAG: hypothetical protein MUF39_09095 [Cyclobacteriaceae bacterium]|jgi:hypothetical protein|nr:hypothetical protein [Cyclobacteriaceae bacterium]